jgi:protein SCO1/2
MIAATCLLLPSPSDANTSRWGSAYLPNVEVMDQNGRTLKFYDGLIKGRIVVISFVYTSCTNICPLTLARLAEVEDALGPAMGRDIHFISVSIDPIPDTPEKLKEHAAAFKTGPAWTFVTGDVANIDLIRYKLGERSGEAIAQHKNEVLMYNDVTGEWQRSSAFADLGVLALTIRSMKPEWRNQPRLGASVSLSAHANQAVGAKEGPGQALFVKACASCHTVGGGEKVGPDLFGLLQRRTAEWVSAYVQNPAKMRTANDPAALELRQRFPAVRMPDLGLSETDVDDVLTYLESRK